MKDRQLSDLIQKAAKGDVKALESIFHEMKNGIYSFALMRVNDGETAEDVLQETILAVYESAGGYTRLSNPRAWILTIARNKAVSELRKRKNMESLDTLRAEISDGKQTEKLVLDSLETAQYLSGLSKADREIVILHVIGGLKHREIAKLLDMPAGTVGRRYSKSIHTMNHLMLDSIKQNGSEQDEKNHGGEPDLSV